MPQVPLVFLRQIASSSVYFVPLSTRFPSAAATALSPRGNVIVTPGLWVARCMWYRPAARCEPARKEGREFRKQAKTFRGIDLNRELGIMKVRANNQDPLPPGACAARQDCAGQAAGGHPGTGSDRTEGRGNLLRQRACCNVVHNEITDRRRVMLGNELLDEAYRIAD